MIFIIEAPPGYFSTMAIATNNLARNWWAQVLDFEERRPSFSFHDACIVVIQHEHLTQGTYANIWYY